MIDGEINSSVTENEAICVRYVHAGLSVNDLVSVTERSQAHADGVTDCIQSSMSKFELDDWKQKLVGFDAQVPNSRCCCKTESGQSKTDRHSLCCSQAGVSTSWHFERCELSYLCK